MIHIQKHHTWCVHGRRNISIMEAQQMNYNFDQETFTIAMNDEIKLLDKYTINGNNLKLMSF